MISSKTIIPYLDLPFPQDKTDLSILQTITTWLQKSSTAKKTNIKFANRIQLLSIPIEINGKTIAINGLILKPSQETSRYTIIKGELSFTTLLENKKLPSDYWPLTNAEVYKTVIASLHCPNKFSPDKVNENIIYFDIPPECRTPEDLLKIFKAIVQDIQKHNPSHITLVGQSPFISTLLIKLAADMVKAGQTTKLIGTRPFVKATNAKEKKISFLNFISDDSRGEDSLFEALKEITWRLDISEDLEYLMKHNAENTLILTIPDTIKIPFPYSYPYIGYDFLIMKLCADFSTSDTGKLFADKLNKSLSYAKNEIEKLFSGLTQTQIDSVFQYLLEKNYVTVQDGIMIDKLGLLKKFIADEYKKYEKACLKGEDQVIARREHDNVLYRASTREELDNVPTAVLPKLPPITYEKIKEIFDCNDTSKIDPQYLLVRSGDKWVPLPDFYVAQIKTWQQSDLLQQAKMASSSSIGFAANMGH